MILAVVSCSFWKKIDFNLKFSNKFSAILVTFNLLIKLFAFVFANSPEKVCVELEYLSILTIICAVFV